MTSPSDRSSRIGRVPRWQRYFTHGALGACALSGVVWFVLMDGCRWLPPRLTFWWIAHGVAVLLSVMGNADLVSAVGIRASDDLDDQAHERLALDTNVVFLNGRNSAAALNESFD